MTARKFQHHPSLLSCIFLTLGLLLAWAPPISAHGVALQAKAGQAVVVSGVYSDGEPLSFVKIKVLNPEGKTHQVGNADAAGRFAFVASGPGKWQVVVEDGMGHKGDISWQEDQAARKLSPSASPAQTTEQPVSASKWERAAWGLSLLFWLSGLVFWRKGIRQARRG